MSKKFKIPHLAFTYWSGDQLSYLNVLTVKTFMHFHPDWVFAIYTNENPIHQAPRSFTSKEHEVQIKKTFTLDVFKDIQNVEIRPIDFKTQYNLDPNLFPTFLADIVRIKKLYEHGGLWTDLDILYLKQIPKEYTSLPYQATLFTVYSNTIATGLISANAKSESLTKLEAEVDAYIKQGYEDNFGGKRAFELSYQAFGPDLWRKSHLDENDKVTTSPTCRTFPVSDVYPFLWNQLEDLYLNKTSTPTLPPNTFAIHWYNGSNISREFINENLWRISEDQVSTPFELALKILRDAKFHPELKSAKPSQSVSQCKKPTSPRKRGRDFAPNNHLNTHTPKGSDFRDANLQNANFEGVDFRFADFRGANLRNANLIGANFEGAVFSDHIAHTSPLTKPQSKPLKISIVIAYFNRKPQLIATLESIKKSQYENLEIVIVDDGSEPSEAVATFIDDVKGDLDVRVVTIPPREKTWVSPSIPYNLGIRYAEGSIVMLQNAEVAHIGDCVSFVAKNLQRKDWLTFNCYGLPNLSSSGDLASLDWDLDLCHAAISKKPSNVGGNSVVRKDPSGWLNHYERHFVAYHYCGAIFRDDLLRHLGGGFDESFANFIGGDDDEFVKRLIHKEFVFKISKFEPNAPFVVHQFHEKTKSVQGWDAQKYQACRLKLSKSLIAMGFAPEIDIQFAPKKETPMSRRHLLTID